MIALFAILLSVHYSKSNAQCPVTNKTFKTGEYLVYEAYYNWGIIWLKAGEVNFSVKDTLYQGNPCYLFTVRGTTYKSYDVFFKVRDTVITIVNRDNLLPIKYYHSTNEGNYQLRINYYFDYLNMSVYGYRQRVNSPRKNTLKTLDPCSFDVLSSVYAVRNFNFDGLAINDKIPLKMIIDNEYYDLYIRYLGKENIKLKNGDTYRCIVFAPLLLEGSMFKGGEKMRVYVTDDKNRIPVYITSDIVVGSVKAILSTAKNVKYPRDAKL